MLSYACKGASERWALEGYERADLQGGANEPRGAVSDAGGAYTGAGVVVELAQRAVGAVGGAAVAQDVA
jgi:hypothetical protein